MESDKEIVQTAEEQNERRKLIHAYLTSTMEKEGNEQEELDRRRELLHAYSRHMMDNYDEQTVQNETDTDTYLRTSAEEEQKSSMKEEYDEDEPFEENDDEGKWMTQFFYPTEEENTLFILFITGNVEDQKAWINAKMNLIRTSTNEEIRRREEEILDRIIPTEMVDLDRTFSEEDEEETDDLSECRPYDLTIDQEEDFISKDYQVCSFSLPKQEESDEFINKNSEEGDIQSTEPLKPSFQDYRRQNEEIIHPLSSTTKLNDQLIGAKYFTELDVHWRYDNEQIKDKDKWETTKTNQQLFEPMVMSSSLYYSPTTSQTKTDKIF
jgi:hypothetical protein